MNKILNWTFGACFRTLGRFLAIFIVFALLLFVGSKLDIELPSWLALKVNASEVNNGYVGECVGCEDIINGYTGKSIFPDITGDSINGTFKLDLVNQFNIYNNTDYINIPVYFQSLEAYKYYTYPTQNGVTETNIYLPINSYTVFIEYKTTDNISKYNTCTFNQQNTNGYGILKCYVFNDVVKINSLALYYSLRNPFSDVQPIKFGYNRNFSFFMKDNTNNQIIQNQDQTNDKLDDMNQTQNQIKDSINNNDTSDAQNSASGFFDNFSTETFGLTSIITAPLNAINSLINSSCNNLVLPLPFVEKNLTLPCMNSIYSNYFKGFFDLYQIITTGLISYYVIVRIFNLVKDFKNPEHDEIEVMDL